MGWHQPDNRAWEPIEVTFDAVSVRVLDAGQGWVRLEASITDEGRKLLTLEPLTVHRGESYVVGLGGKARGPLAKVS